jgi:hypothetical protein
MQAFEYLEWKLERNQPADFNLLKGWLMSNGIELAIPSKFPLKKLLDSQKMFYVAPLIAAGGLFQTKNFNSFIEINSTVGYHLVRPQFSIGRFSLKDLNTTWYIVARESLVVSTQISKIVWPEDFTADPWGWYVPNSHKNNKVICL